MLLLPYYAHLLVLILTACLVVLLAARIYLRRTVIFKCDERLDGKTVVVTGGNSGIGHAASVELARRGAKVILGCRDRTRRDSAPFAVRSRSGNIDVRFLYLDLSSLDSVVQFARELVEQETRIDVLINNAGVLCPRGWTVDGLDETMSVNAFGPFLLANLLKEKLKATGGRVLNLVSDAYRSATLDQQTLDMAPTDQDYTMYKAYAASKLALVLITKEMATRFKSDGILVFAINPGSVNTKLFRHCPGWGGQLLRTAAKLVFRTPEDGAQTVLHCAMTKMLDKETGKLFYNCYPSELKVNANDDDSCQQLWDKIETVLKSKSFPLTLKEYDDE